MALTVTSPPVNRDRVGQRIEVTFDFTLDNSYPTGGYAVTPAQLGLAQIETLDVPENPAGYLFTYDRANKKLKVFQFNYPGGAAGAATEVPNATNLAAVVGRAVARGF